MWPDDDDCLLLAHVEAYRGIIYDDLKSDQLGKAGASSLPGSRPGESTRQPSMGSAGVRPGLRPGRPLRSIEIIIYIYFVQNDI